MHPPDEPIDRDLASALDALDYPIRRVSADVIIQRARVRSAQRRWRIAAAAVVMLAASVAAALPGSPVRRWVMSALRSAPAPETPAQPRAEPTPGEITERAPDMRGVVTSISSSAEVTFSDWQAAGEVVIRLIPASELRVRSAVSPAGYQVRPDGIRVSNPGSRASYELDVADRAEVVRVLANGRTIFERRGGQVVRGPNPRPDGAYVVSLRAVDHR